MGGKYKYSMFATEERYCSTLVRGQPRGNKELCSEWGAQRVNKHEHSQYWAYRRHKNGELLFFVYTSCWVYRRRGVEGQAMYHESIYLFLLEWHQLSCTKTRWLYVMIEVTPLLKGYWMNGRTQTDANSMSFDQKISHRLPWEIMHLISSTCKLYSITWLYNVAHLHTYA